MRIILSRKGFDSTSGGGPSPIIGGRPLSLPIPAAEHSRTTYGALGLGEHAARASRGRIGAGDHCHHDPMFLADGTCLFGQCGAAQTHLANRGVGGGDVFLFFGLFRDEDTGEPHHRIFGYLEVERRIDLASCDAVTLAGLRDQGHPHAIAMHGRNDAIYSGRGREVGGAPHLLRLTVPGGPPSLWRRPVWLRCGGLSYHDRTDRWLPGGRLRAVSRGQEFVAEIGRRKAPREWLARVIAAIEAS
ncbi:Nmad3 family putative nucleotide modification protein [Pelagerythrobacter aerophilus]|uniref:Nucleotide modification associated domain-containing protein n=1 Tax=Pelagerythrobacter aerophilus TaxID=2306995 RepID=A0A418NCQ4_9SPHN|nr:hypothetical protein [Pelagerythrobacter aerophilus]RIV75592.1 hypothetical protein D2V04_14960 [Pelagerythrobacter aerophilus]